jgi:hypothetical protein
MMAALKHEFPSGEGWGRVMSLKDEALSPL